MKKEADFPLLKRIQINLLLTSYQNLYQTVCYMLHGIENQYQNEYLHVVMMNKEFLRFMNPGIGGPCDKVCSYWSIVNMQ